MSGSQQRGGGPGASIMVQEVMQEEWSALRSEDQRLPSLRGPEGMAEVGGSPPRCPSVSPVALSDVKSLREL